MGSGYLLSPLMLIINTLFDLYILLVLLRFLLQVLRADFYNPVSQFIVKLTTPPLRILRRIIPSVAGQDVASIVLCLILIYAKFLVMRLLSIPAVQIGGVIAPIGTASYGGLLVYCIADLIALWLTVMLIAVIIKVILSWINPGHYNPVIGLVDKIAEPVLGPIRKLLPPLGGFDLSPLFASLLILVAKMLIVPPIVYLGNF
ncbi:MAG: Cell division integral membrane protein, YggT and half-length relatives [Olavius algarvensis Gamma 3 endosymbiont]|nr:MAG: Cell division integral membrane protein, YggT and half-length relatives [Olavius algarvensis Gamma 3 endosymbiont]